MLLLLRLKGEWFDAPDMEPHRQQVHQSIRLLMSNSVQLVDSFFSALWVPEKKSRSLQLLSVNTGGIMDALSKLVSYHCQPRDLFVRISPVQDIRVMALDVELTIPGDMSIKSQ